MKILYLSNLLSEQKLNDLKNKYQYIPQMQAQKYHKLFVEGLSLNNIEKLDILSTIPITSKINKKLFWKFKRDRVGNRTYHYVPFINLPILRNISILIYTFFYIIKWSLKHKEDAYIISDCLQVSLTLGIFFSNLFFKRNKVCILTDLPDFLDFSVKKNNQLIKKLIKSTTNQLIKKYDYYIVMTEDMNQMVNQKNKPHLIIEGFVDYQMEHEENNLENKFDKKIVLYAGALYEKFGVKKLVDVFHTLSRNDAELWIYGDGELNEYIDNLGQQNTSIKFYGYVENKLVIESELKATILVNTRPTDEIFTKYSFPSKNMEYMSTGTPLLTTKLPGLPIEYYPYVYLLEDESFDGLKKTLNDLLDKDQQELHTFGQEAKQFVLVNKNNIKQAEKVIQFLNRNLEESRNE